MSILILGIDDLATQAVVNFVGNCRERGTLIVIHICLFNFHYPFEKTWMSINRASMCWYRLSGLCMGFVRIAS